MPKKFPPEFKRDVVAVARRADTTLTETAADFDISTSTLKRWMAQADIDDGIARATPALSTTSWCSCGGGTAVSSRRSRSCGERPRTSRGTQPQNDVPAGP